MCVTFRSNRRMFENNVKICKLCLEMYRRENSKLIGRHSRRYHRRSDGCFAGWPVNTTHNEGRVAKLGQTTALSDNYFKSKSHLSASATCENHYRVIIKLLPWVCSCSRPRWYQYGHMSNRDTSDRSKANLLHNDSALFESTFQQSPK